MTIGADQGCLAPGGHKIHESTEFDSVPGMSPHGVFNVALLPPQLELS